MKKIGIDAISYYVPSIYLSIEQLSEKRNLDFQKLNKGLGLEKMAIADSNEDPSSFAANALIDLFEKNNLDPHEIGRIYMGTESALDASKPSATYATDLVEKYFTNKFGERCLKNCDITDFGAIEASLKGFSVKAIFHLAAINGTGNFYKIPIFVR